MKAAVIEHVGAAPRYTDFDDPVPAEGELVVEVRAAGLHRIVRAIASGSHYLGAGPVPFIPGIDGAGRLGDGTRVYFGISRPPFGSFAQRTVTHHERCIPLPEAIDDVTAAALANAGMSSWGALTERAGFVPGESVLVLGATGVAGRLAVQVARVLGARRVVAAGRDDVALGSAGADATIRLGGDRTALVRAFREVFDGDGVDVVLDYVWGEPAEIVLEAIAGRASSSRVRYLEIGSVAGRTITLDGATLRSTPVELLGSGFGSASTSAIIASLRTFFAAAERHSLRVDAHPVPLADVERAWADDGEKARVVFVP